MHFQLENPSWKHNWKSNWIFWLEMLAKHPAGKFDWESQLENQAETQLDYSTWNSSSKVQLEIPSGISS